MVDVNIEVKEILSDIKCSVQYQYPDNFKHLPVITFYTLREGMGMTADNIEIIEDASVQIDIWSFIPKELGNLAIKVNEVMTKSGWNRQFSMDCKKENNIYHRTMRFNKSIVL